MSSGIFRAVIKLWILPCGDVSVLVKQPEVMAIERRAVLDRALRLRQSLMVVMAGYGLCWSFHALHSVKQAAE